MGNPFLIPAISGASSLLGGISSSLFSSSSVDKQLDAQRQENAKNRKFNAEQASLARQYNTQMVQDARNYDLPENVMSRLKAAGINPALAYTNGQPITSVGVGSTTQQAAGSNGSVGTSLPDYSGLSHIGINAAMSTQALSSSAESNARRGLTEKEIEWFDRTKEKDFAVSDSVIFNNDASGKLSLDERRKLATEIPLLQTKQRELEQNIRESASRLNLNDAEAALKEIDLRTRDALNQATIRELVTKTGLNEAHAFAAVKAVMIQAMLADSQLPINEATAKTLRNQCKLQVQEYRAGLPAAKANALRYNAESNKFYINNAYGLASLGAATHIASVAISSAK